MTTDARTLRRLVPLSGVALVVIAWQLLAMSGWLSATVFPGPVDVLGAAVNRVPLDELGRHLAASLTRVTLGFLMGAALGVFLGVALGWYRWLGRILWSPIELLRPIPPLAWIPLALIWFGLGESSKVFIIFLGAFFPILINTYKGMTTLDPMLLRVGQTLGLDGWKMLTRIAIPGAMPDIATGLRVGWSLAFGSLVAAEILAANEGLGYLIMNGRELGDISIVVYGIILIGLLSLITDYLINRFILQRQLRWHFGAE